MVIKERRAMPTPAKINDMAHPKIIIKKQLTKSNLTYFFFTDNCKATQAKGSIKHSTDDGKTKDYHVKHPHKECVTEHGLGANIIEVC